MTVDEDAGVEPRGREVVGVLLKEFTDQERLLAQSLRTQLAWKKASQLIPKHRSTTRLEDHDRRSGIDLGRQFIHHPTEIRLRAAEHPEVVERSPTAEPR
jgi:hypothetical protein